MKKRLLSIIIVLALCLTLLPTAALATEPTPYEIAISLNGTPVDGKTELRVSDLAGKTELAAVIACDALDTVAEQSATVKVKWSFEPFGTNGAASASRTDTFSSDNDGTADDKVISTFSLVKDTSEAVVNGVYTIDVGTLTKDGNAGPSMKYQIELIPSDAVARISHYGYEYVETEGYVQSVESNEYFTSFPEAFNKAAEYCDIDYATLVMFEDLTDFTSFGTAKAVDWLTVDANGHRIGATNAYLPVDGWVTFENLSDTVYLKLVGYNSDVSVNSVADDFTAIVVDCENNPADYSGWMIDSSTDGNNQPLVDASKVVINESGYAAVDSKYGVAIAKTTDYPYALLTTGDNPRFVFFSSILTAKEKLEAAAANTYDGSIYVMNYQNTASPSLSRQDYYYPGSVDTATAALLKTFIRVTNGMVSDFYMYENSAWRWKYNNIGGAAAYNSANVPTGTGYNAKVYVLSGDTAEPAEGGVAISTTWPEITGSTTFTATADTAIGAGAYKITASGTVSIDVSALGANAAYAKYTLIGGEAAAPTVEIIGNGAENVDFNLFGTFASVSAANATVNIGSNDATYVGDTKIGDMTVTGAKVTAFNGQDYHTYEEFPTTNKLEFGHITVGEGGYLDLFGADIGGKAGTSAALEILDADSTACIDNSRISYENAGAAAPAAVKNQGDVVFYGTKITSSDACGVKNSGGSVYFSQYGERYNTLEVTKGSGIVSSGADAYLSISNLTCTLTSSVSGSCGVDAQNGVLYVASGEWFTGETSKISIDAGAGTALKIGEDTEWTLQGVDGRLSFKGANALVADGTTAYRAPEGRMVSAGVFDGAIRICESTGKAALEKLIPAMNFAVEVTPTGYRIVNYELEFRRFLKEDFTNPEYVSTYKLPCDIVLGDLWTSYVGLSDSDGGAILVGQGKHVIDFNGYSVYSGSIDEALIEVVTGTDLRFCNTGAAGSQLRSTNAAAAVALVGGTFVNGGTNEKAVDIINQSADEGASIIQLGGQIDLYGAKYQGMIDVMLGNINIYGGEYELITELYMDASSENGMHIYGGKFTGSDINDPDNVRPAILSVSMFGAFGAPGALRPMTAATAEDTTAVIPYGYTIHPYLNGWRISDSYMQIDVSDAGDCGAAVKGTNTYLQVEKAGAGPVYFAPTATETAAPAPDESSSYDTCPQDADCPIKAFGDLDVNAWYHHGVHYCLDNGLMSGVDSGVFDPTGTVTRAMIVTMLWRLDGQNYPNYFMRFKDVPASQWYTEAVRWAAAEKIVSGYDAEHFGPDDPVTREQLAVILYNYAKYKGQGFTGAWMFLLDFADRASISSWADEAAHWCSMNGVITGKDGKVFDPQGCATRAEAAAMMQRFCEALEK